MFGMVTPTKPELIYDVVPEKDREVLELTPMPQSGRSFVQGTSDAYCGSDVGDFRT